MWHRKHAEQKRKPARFETVQRIFFDEKHEEFILSVRRKEAERPSKVRREKRLKVEVSKDSIPSQ